MTRSPWVADETGVQDAPSVARLLFSTTLLHYSSPSPTAAASPWSGVCLRGNVSSNASSSGSLPPAHSAEDRTVGRLHVAAATPPILASRLARTGHVGAPCVVLEVDAGIFI